MSDPVNTDFQRLTSLAVYGVDIPGRTIHLFGGVEERYEYVAAGIHLMQNSDDPIDLLINSPGGDDDALFHLYDTIQASHPPIHTTVVGMACSAAALLLACGHERYAYESAMFMAHKGEYSFSGDDDAVIASAECIERTAELYWALLARHTGKHSAKWWYEKSRDSGQLWLNAKQMVQHGVVDYIIKPAVTLPPVKIQKLRSKK